MRAGATFGYNSVIYIGANQNQNCLISKDIGLNSILYELYSVLMLDLACNFFRLPLIASLEHIRDEGHQNGSDGVLILGCKVHQLRESFQTGAKQMPNQTGF